MIIRLGDKEVDYNPDFKFYITTKLSNPHYAPEISTKTTIVNFAVKEQGLEAQLLGIVVRKERPELEESKDKLVVNIASSKKKLADLEDEILRYYTTPPFWAFTSPFSYTYLPKFFTHSLLFSYQAVEHCSRVTLR